MCLSTTPVLSSKTFHINTNLDLCSRIGWTVMEFAWCGIATCWALIQRRAAIHSPRTPLSIFSCSLHHMKAFELFSSLHINPPRPLLVWKTLRTVLWRFGAVSVSLSLPLPIYICMISSFPPHRQFPSRLCVSIAWFRSPPKRLRAYGLTERGEDIACKKISIWLLRFQFLLAED